MNIIKKTTLAATVALTAAAFANAQTSQRLTADKTNEYGLIYTLPSTNVEVSVCIQRTVRKPGQFHNYAKKYLNASDAIMRPDESVKVTQVVLNSYGVADPEKRYLAQFKNGSTPYMSVSSENTPLNINTEETYIVPSASIAEPEEPAENPLESEAARQAVTQEMIQSSSTAKKAELAAARIYELREARNEIISGRSDQSFPDGKALQLALDNLSAQEAALTAMFLGTTIVSYDMATYTIEPGDEDFANKVIARISPVAGFVNPSDLSGEPLTLSMTIDEKGELPVNEKGVTKTFPKGGVAYCIPGKATFTVRYENRTLATATFDIAQAGVVFGLDPGMFTDKKAPAFVVFNPTTGAIVELGTK